MANQVIPATQEDSALFYIDRNKPDYVVFYYHIIISSIREISTCVKREM